MDKELRNEKGQWLAPPPGSENTRITTANARSMAQKRWEKYRQQAVKRIVGEATSIDPSVSTGADAFGLVASKQFAALMDSEKPRIGDLEKLGQIMTGLTSERENAASPANSAITAPPAALLELAARLESEIAARVERARAIDGEVKPSEGTTE